MGKTRDRPEIQRVFGQRVRARRLELGYSQERLAEVAQMHWTYLASVERGERNIALRNIVSLAVALGVDPGTLVEGLSPA